MSCYRCCCVNEPVIFSHCVHLKLGHRFHALLKVCSALIVMILSLKVGFEALHGGGTVGVRCAEAQVVKQSLRICNNCWFSDEPVVR